MMMMVVAALFKPVVSRILATLLVLIGIIIIDSVDGTVNDWSFMGLGNIGAIAAALNQYSRGLVTRQSVDECQALQREVSEESLKTLPFKVNGEFKGRFL